MSAKVEHSSTTGAVMPPASTASGVKVSKFATKSGFLIPKNKLSGSLIPIFRGSKKGIVDASKEDNDKQVQRKTKWGPDLTQDTAVKRGRALAYQTRVDQITEELRWGKSKTWDNQDLASQVPDINSSNHQYKSQELETLELEKREAIGELLKLNPRYKAPADYKPLLKEAKVPIPIAECPGHNYVGLIFGPGNDTHKRLEKETGAKIRVYGLEADTGLEVQISATDGSDTYGGYSDFHVHISADTYEKVDAAVALIELLFMPVSGHPASGSIPSVCSENVNSNAIAQGKPSNDMGGAAASAQPNMAAELNDFPQSTGPWFSLTEMSPPFNPSMFGPRSSASAGFTPVPQSPAFVPLGPRQPPVSQHQYLPQPPPVHHIGAPRNMFMPVSQSASIRSNMTPSQVLSNQAAGAEPGPFFRPLIPSLPQSSHAATLLDQPQAPSGWSKAPSENQTLIGSGTMMPKAPAVSGSWGPSPLASQPASAAVNNPISVPFFNSGAQSQMGFSPTQLSPAVASPIPFQGPPPSVAPMQPVVPQIPRANSSLNVVPGSTPLLSPMQSNPALLPVSGSGGAGSFNPMAPPHMIGPRPQQPSASDFTFQPHRPQHAEFEVSNRPQVRPIHVTPNQSLLPPQGSQNPFVQPPIHNLRSPFMAHGFGRPSVGSQMVHPGAQTSLDFQGSLSGIPPRHAANAGPLMQPRNFNMAPPPANSGAVFPGPGDPLQFQHNHPAAATRPQGFVPPNPQINSNATFNRPSPNSFRFPQVYDPFSPTSVSHNPRPSNNGAMRPKQESNDPEYEDLMASVGVK
ncbi:OLC1v1006000C1 [Oldenlandia corymbosa var. corymbosa]|uniref:OLC1v1006000C1 n=1 Tax=Oldenlandia corymbosa var. corymbosa TaxID=529605 RepID=A0AAV1DFY4_OLDCO|nr:OLC1v1006000C1 [Oldenlandia corymbosa var. corymbosa]